MAKSSPSKSKFSKVREPDKSDEKLQKEKEERLKASLERLTSEERLRVAKMIQKHSEEMLLMIAEKLAGKEVLILLISESEIKKSLLGVRYK